MEKDYSLLRQFDLEAAKRGEPICYCNDGSKRIYLAGPDNSNRICVEDTADGRFVLANVDKYRMAPLCWVEGKPVYKGDVLYDKHHGTRQEVRSAGSHETLETVQPRRDGSFVLCLEDATWTPPNVKREGWVNIYPRFLDEPVASVSHAYSTKEAADAVANDERIACVRIEWEE